MQNNIGTIKTIKTKQAFKQALVKSKDKANTWQRTDKRIVQETKH